MVGGPLSSSLYSVVYLWNFEAGSWSKNNKKKKKKRKDWRLVSALYGVRWIILNLLFRSCIFYEITTRLSKNNQDSIINKRGLAPKFSLCSELKEVTFEGIVSRLLPLFFNDVKAFRWCCRDLPYLNMVKPMNCKLNKLEKYNLLHIKQDF